MSTHAAGTAGWDLTRQMARPYVPDPCRCDQHKYGQQPAEPGKDALLYYGPGITDRTWQSRVRSGQWDDIPAEFDAAASRVHLAAVSGARRICRAVDGERHRIGVMFGANPSLHFDARVAQGLREVEERLAGWSGEMHRASEARLAALREQPAETGDEA